MPISNQPFGLEGIDDVLIEGMKKKHLHPRDFELLPEGRGWLLVEFGGENKEEADAKAQALMNELRSTKAPPTMRLYDAPFSEQHIWHIRESGLGGSARIPGEPDGRRILVSPMTTAASPMPWNVASVLENAAAWKAEQCVPAIW